MAKEEIMTLKEVAQYLKMKERTIYKWAQNGKIPAIKLGSTWRFRKEEVNAWLEKNRNIPDRP